MRYVVRGALAAVLVYPLFWYSATSDAGSASETKVGQAAAHEREPTAPRAVASRDPALEDSAPRRSSTRSERVAAAEPPGAPALPSMPSVPGVRAPEAQPPEVVLPDMAELKESFARMAELQKHAHDPAELDRRVQTMQEDPAKLERLKAIADMFVQLPDSRREDYLRPEGPRGGSR